MSLINQMLQDLDKRGAHPASTDPIQAHISVLTVQPKSLRNWLVPMLIIAALLVLAWLAWTRLLPLRQHALSGAPATNISAAMPPAQTSVTVVEPATAGRFPIAATIADQLISANDAPVMLKLSAGLSKPISLDTSVNAPGSTSHSAVSNVPKNAADETATAASDKPALEMIDRQKTSAVKNVANPAANPAISPLNLKKDTDANAGDSVGKTSKAIKETTPQQQAESDYRQALIWQQQGRLAEAIQMLEHALLANPQHSAARQSLIAFLVEDKRIDDAMRVARQALTQDPNQPSLAMMLARLQVDKGSLANAIETLQRTLPSALGRADYLAFLAALLQRESRHKEAIDLYQRALKAAPQNGVWWMGLGLSLQADSRNSDALDAYNRAKNSRALSPELAAFVEQKIAQLAH